ncbi:MAG: diguanylate cyclase [Desulforhopalus sp.]|nr:diguanylate cyclase [Desulforhopalus sp.]
MNYSLAFYKSIIDSVTDSIVVIDRNGTIHFVNRSWTIFGQKNGYPVSISWLGMNYLATCGQSASSGDQYGKIAAEGIETVISHEAENFYLEYPCHSTTEKRWFMMRVSPLDLAEEKLFVISHQNITERKLAEEEVLNLSRIDGLTEIANRRFFDIFIDEEWRRCERLGLPISLLLLDIDHFKLYNDTYGHIAGDECLKKVGKILRMFGKRPGDLSARYGGEEFVIVLGNTRLADAVHLAQDLLKAFMEQSIPFQCSPVADKVTVSIGVAAIIPQKGIQSTQLIDTADTMLYAAKKNGRNRIEYHDGNA